MWQSKLRLIGTAPHSLLALATALGLLAMPVLAAPSDQVLRERYLKAEKGIHQASSEQAARMLRDLHDYPLKPYLELELISRSLSDTNRVKNFLNQHQGSPLEWTLKKRWLMYLASVGLSQPYLKNYQIGTDTVLDCYALQLRLQNEPAAKIWPAVSEIWTVGESRPKECDALFSRWQKAGQRTPEVIWARLKNVADGGDERLIPYLRTLLPKNQQYLGDKWKQVIENPSLVQRQKFLPLKHRWEREILAYALKKMIWKQPEQALKVWQRFEADPQFTKAQRTDVARQFAIALASKDDPRASKFISMVPVELKDDLFIQWQLAFLLRQQRWADVEAMLLELPQESLKKDHLQYWLARAYQQQGKTDAAQQVLGNVALQRSYYGFMAAAKLGLKPSLAHKPVPVTAAQYQAFKQSGSIARMYEWEAIGRPNAARRELTFLQKFGSETQKLSAAKYAYDKGWYDRAIFALADAGYWDDVDMRFPMVFNKEIQKHAKAARVDPAWAMAITRRESTFIPTAKSPVGAHGLMQIMPQTAKHITGRRVPVETLYNPNINIDMGTDYLNYLMRQNDNNLVFATASYNAGYSRVKSWLPKQGQMPIDIWIETIPFKETREYVKAVLAYYQIYNIRMNQKHDVFVPLSTMQVGQAS
jgi:soluble lytic murein transglycosylase